MKKVLIIGAGYAGLAAATELTDKEGFSVDLVEKSDSVGGLSRTYSLGGKKFEIGPHIYFDKDKEVRDFWVRFIGNGYRSYRRNNRIFYAGKYIDSPLNLFNTFFRLGPIVVASILWSFLKSRLIKRSVKNAEDWVVNNFGFELYSRFFKVYNEKIWGIDASKISPNWAGQRIKTSLLKMVWKSVKRDHDFIIKTFDFPDGGSVSIYEKQEEFINNSSNIELMLNKNIESIKHTEKHGFTVTYSNDVEQHSYDYIISTIHLKDLSDMLFYENKNEIDLSHALDSLIYRNLVLVNLLFNKQDVIHFKEHWIDIHDPNVEALRVTNFLSYRFEDGPDDKVVLSLEYNCFLNDAIWNSSDLQMVNLASEDLGKMKLITTEPLDFKILRLDKAYPVYSLGFEEYLAGIKKEYSKLPNLILAGRNAMFKWNNMHHSVKTGILAAKNVQGKSFDLEEVKGMVTIGKDSD